MISKDELEKDINEISKKGIQADRQRLKEDMCAQFSDYREWMREYVVNAYDAQATSCVIKAREGKDTITIIIIDNGIGMDKQRLIDFYMIFRSVKPGDPRTAVGRHGVGKNSVAAIPGQSRFSILTSTGNESWRVSMGCLLDDAPIKLERIEPVTPRGTRFEITFKKDVSLTDEMNKLSEILYKYVRYLPMEVIVFTPEKAEGKNYRRSQLINKTWDAGIERCGRQYNFELSGRDYEVMFNLGQQKHELYQNRVFITDKYNLFSHGKKDCVRIPHISLRIDSPDFELPFGRHCLRNEEILEDLSNYIRTKVLSQYVVELCRDYEVNILNGYDLLPGQVEDIVCSMLEVDQTNKPWCKMPIFNVHNSPRMSFIKLQEHINCNGKLYIEDSNDAGIDYTIFDAPVLKIKQPGDGLVLLKKLFKDYIVNLSVKELVMESLEEKSNTLSLQEKKFEQYLCFHPETINNNILQNNSSIGSNEEQVSGFNQNLEVMSGACEEAKLAKDDLDNMQFRVGRLVGRDGKTPCLTHRFLLKDGAVVLNLNHPEINQYVKLSEQAPALAGHFALASCVTEGKSILPHLSPEAREDLVLADAMAKCGMKAPPEQRSRAKKSEDDVSSDFDFLINCLEDYRHN